MNDDTEILKVTKFHDAMIRSITGQPGHLYAGEALSIGASGCCRRRCARVCGCPLSRVRRRLRLSAFCLAQESDMMKVVPVEEQQRSDYLPLMTTLKIRFAALKLACDGTVDVAKVFASIDLVGDMEGQASEASLRGITVQNAMSLLARLLKERKLPWPIADFDKCQALRQLSLRVALVGEAANTLQDVKEAKAEFAAHTGQIEELIKATKRAGDDVSARVNQKLKMTTLKIRLQKY